MILVDVLPTGSWLGNLRQWACGLGITLDVFDATDLEFVGWRDYDLVVIGSSMASQSPGLIMQIRYRNRSAKIMVFSGRPDWREAREALLAGAVDYAPIPEDFRSLADLLEEALNKAPNLNPLGMNIMESES
jgi:DNA-binding NtrC family response regulator